MVGLRKKPWVVTSCLLRLLTGIHRKHYMCNWRANITVLWTAFTTNAKSSAELKPVILFCAGRSERLSQRLLRRCLQLTDEQRRVSEPDTYTHISATVYA